jgi:hypothetical protein
MKIAGMSLTDTADAARAERRRSAGPPGAAGDSTGSAGPFKVRARVTIMPWTDLVFAREVRAVMRAVSLSAEVTLGSGSGAVLAERLLRARGYGNARVIDLRTTDEALRRVAHWQVLRDGERMADGA